MSSSFSPWPKYSNEEIEAVTKVLKSGQVNYWTGNECRDFEEEFASFSGSKFAICLANGTVAIDIALKTLGIGYGDEVIVTPRTYIASVSAIVNAGAKPIFADVDRDTQNITVDTIKLVLSKKTKAIVCVHLAGWPCDMDPIMSLARSQSLFVIEDCAQAHAAKYKGKSVGSIGHIGCWSFCQDKIMTTGGEGGMVTTDDKTLWQKMWSYKDHGKSWDAVYNKSYPLGFKWLHESFGTNWRMNEIQAVLGRSQLHQIKGWNTARRSNLNAIYETAFKISNLRVPQLNCSGCSCSDPGNQKCIHGAYKCYIFVKGDKILRDKMLQDINARGVPCYTGTCSEVYLEKAFDNTALRPKKRLSVAKELGETSLMFLCHPTLTLKEITKTCVTLREVACSYL